MNNSNFSYPAQTANLEGRKCSNNLQFNYLDFNLFAVVNLEKCQCKLKDDFRNSTTILEPSVKPYHRVNRAQAEVSVQKVLPDRPEVRSFICFG